MPTFYNCDGCGRSVWGGNYHHCYGTFSTDKETEHEHYQPTTERERLLLAVSLMQGTLQGLRHSSHPQTTQHIDSVLGRVAVLVGGDS